MSLGSTDVSNEEFVELLQESFQELLHLSVDLVDLGAEGGQEGGGGGGVRLGVFSGAH